MSDAKKLADELEQIHCGGPTTHGIALGDLHRRAAALLREQAEELDLLRQAWRWLESGPSHRPMVKDMAKKLAALRARKAGGR